MRYFKILLIGVFLLAFILRFYKLGAIPNGISNDEAGYIYSAYSIWETGRDVAGKFLPLSINLDNSFSPVPVYIIAPFVGMFDLTAFWGRFPFALFGFLTIVVFYFLVKKLLNKEIALFATFAFVVSPWHLQLSRTALDGIFALFFYLLGFYIFTRTYKKGSILWSLPFFLLAFYSYHATKIFFIFFIPFLVYYYRSFLLPRKKELVLFVLGFILILTSFFYISNTQHVTRQKVFFWSDEKKTNSVIFEERFDNTAPHKVRILYSNKLFYYGRIARENYLEALSPQFLFLHGEQSGIAAQYGTLYRGVLYIIELPLVVLGIYYLLSKKKKIALLVLGGLLIAPLSSAFTADRSHVVRSIMMLPFLMILVGCGVLFILEYIKKFDRWKKFVISGLLFGFYVFLFSIYLYQYYFRYPVYAAESWKYSTKEVVSILSKSRKEYKNISVTYGNPMFLLEYGFYEKLDPKKVQYAWTDFRHRKIDGINYIHDCMSGKDGVEDPNVFLPESSLYIVPNNCYPQAVPSYVIYDKGELIQGVWKLYTKK